MKKYYFIPTTATTVKHNGMTLKEHLKYIDTDLYNRERDFLEFVYGRIFYLVPKGNELNEIIEKQRREDKIIYKEHFVPDRLIIVQEDNKYHELASYEPIEVPDELFINSYEITEKEVQKIINEDDDYSAKTISFFHTFATRFERNSKLTEDFKSGEKKQLQKTYKRNKLFDWKNKNL